MNYIDQLNQADSESSEPDTPNLSTHSSYNLSKQSSTVAEEDRDGQQDEEEQSEAPKINFMPSESGPQSLINISACEFNEF